MSTESHVYRLPWTFAQDHWNRDCGRSDIVVGETKRYVFVRMTGLGLSDMESDADYYGTGVDFLEGLDGIIFSARATYATLQQQIAHIEEHGRSPYDKRFEGVGDIYRQEVTW